MDANGGAAPDDQGDERALERGKSLVGVAAESLGRQLHRVRWPALPDVGSAPIWALIAVGLVAGVILGLLVTA